MSEFEFMDSSACYTIYFANSSRAEGYFLKSKTKGMRTTNSFGIRFVIRGCLYNDGKSKIFARVTVNGRRVEISLKRTIDSTQWDGDSESVKGYGSEARQINRHIEETRFGLRECYQQLLNGKKLVTASAVKSLYLGEDEQENTLCSLLTYHSENMKNVLERGTLKNYSTTEKYVKRFLLHRYRAEDILLTSLNFQFITEFEFYLRKTKPLAENNPLTNNGIMKHLERLRKMVTLAVKLEWLPKDPFARYQLRFHRVEKDFLSGEELEKIETESFAPAKLERARDMFVFSCYTGLAYVDLIELRESNICIGIDGEKWIRTARKKTEVPVSIPLLRPAQRILEKYRQDPDTRNKGLLLPVISNQKINEYLKSIASHCGIDRHLNFHVARHTFATTITLGNGVPLETVSRMLGHTKLTTTQGYVHVLERKICNDTISIRKKFARD